MKVGGREVVASGTLITHYDDAVVELNYQNLTYRLNFLSIPSPSDASISAEVVEGRLEITLINFDNPLGTTWFGEVGTVGDKKLYLSFVVHGIGAGKQITRSIGYTFTTSGAG